MRNVTQDLIETLKKMRWFERPDISGIKADWVMTHSRVEAAAAAASPEWLKFRLMVSNRMHRDLSQLNYTRFTEWNAISSEIQGAAAPTIDLAAVLWAQPNKVTKEARLSLAWDIQGMCMETEFADLMPPLFFVPVLLDCYRLGRRPCGWIGPEIDERWAGASSDPLPAGKLLVF